MNHREPPSLPTGVSRALRSLSLLLLPLLAPDTAPALPPNQHAFGHGGAGQGGDPLPYLAFVGAPPLRFQKAVLPSEVVTRPAAGAPPIPSLTPTEAAVALANAAATRSATAGASSPDGTASPATKSDSKNAPASASAKPAPTPILPDDTRPAVRPEDFLPYFQIPGAGRQPNEVNVIMPASVLTAPAAAPLPPSSATYTQSPR